MDPINLVVAQPRPEYPLKVMQFGAGNFLRAFADWMIQVLNEETDFKAGVVVIKPTERGSYELLKTQEGLFTVLLEGFSGGSFHTRAKMVNCIQQVINPYNDWQAYMDLAKNPDIKFIISNTTESGIKFNGGDQLSDSAAVEFPAKLTSWLYRRYDHFGNDPAMGCILLPCELIEDNGETLKSCILQYAIHWNLGSDFEDWIESSHSFCNTLVDRIVSGYPADRVQEIQEELGYTDMLLACGEYYHSWVIQGPEDVRNAIPFAQTSLNVEFVEDLSPYRELKVRLLNGAHTAMVPLGYLAGLRLVKEVMDHEAISGFIEKLLTDEVIKTLHAPEEAGLKFTQSTLDRFRNPSIKHQLISISLNSTSKFVTRLLPTLIDYLKLEGTLPPRIVFSLAALLLFYRGELKGETIPLKDDEKRLDFFKESWKLWEQHNWPLDKLVGRILQESHIWGQNLDDIKGLRKLITNFLSDMVHYGILQALEKCKAKQELI